MSKKLRIHEFAELVGRSTSTIRRWESEGKLSVKRLPSGQRYFDESDVRLVQGRAPAKKLRLVYCRVSGPAQKDDLASQVKAMEQFCLGAGFPVDEWISEIGGGMNFKRKQFLRIIGLIQRGDVQRLVIAHKDRLTRFGFDLIDHIAQENGCEIVVANQESHSPEQEMVEDLMAIVHTFSCRLHGMRKYKKDLHADYPDARIGEGEVS